MKEQPLFKWAVFKWVGRVLALGLVPYILVQNRAPTSTLAWIWAVVGLPWIGPLAFFIFGGDRMVRKRVREVAKVHGRRVGREAEFSAEARAMCHGLTTEDRAVAQLLARVNETPASSAEGIRLLVDAHRFYPALHEAIRQARDHVHVEFFIYQADRHGEALLREMVAAQQRGVEVRVLLDQGGCQMLAASFFDPLVEAGGKFGWFRSINPLRNRWSFNLKNHRKLQIIDGEVAFVGGMNLGGEYMGESPQYGEWRDVQAELRGEVAAELQRVFVEDWFYATEERLEGARYFPRSGRAPHRLVQVVSDGPDIPEDRIQMSVVALLNAARERAWLTAGYFVPHEPLLTALQLAAARGVDVRLLVSEKSDHPYLVQCGRSFYEALLHYGVRVFEYERGINHAKVGVFDGKWMMIGSANFDIRSMRLNFELNVVVHDPENATELERVLRDDYDKDSKEIVLDEWKRRPRMQRFLESAFRPLAPLL
jgi:cardiolipin synthase A/B